MKSLLTNRKAGVYVLIVSILLQLVSAVNYLVWAPGAGGIDTLVALGLGIGCLVGDCRLPFQQRFAAGG